MKLTKLQRRERAALMGCEKLAGTDSAQAITDVVSALRRYRDAASRLHAAGVSDDGWQAEGAFFDEIDTIESLDPDGRPPPPPDKV